MQLNDLLFDSKAISTVKEAPPPPSKNLKAADFKLFLEEASHANPIPDTQSQAGSAKPLSLKEEYVALLPKLGGLEFGPPVSNYDVGAELNRLAKIELKVEAMEQAGEIDKALDAFIGLHGLKDKLTREEKQELRGRFVELTKAVLLEDEWQNAYLGAMKTRIDVSIEGLREFLLGDEGKPQMVEVGIETPYGDPDLMSFVRDSKWNDFSPPEFSLIAKADQMRLEAKRARELAG